jgi:hypothetical protein
MKKMPSFGMAGDIIYEPMWVSDNYTDYLQTLIFVDPSGRGSDETGVCVSSFANGYIFIHELLGLEGGYDKSVLLKICQLARDYDVKNVFVESNFGDAMFCQLLAPVANEVCGHNLGIEEFRVKGQKEARMLDVLEPVLSQHRLVFNKKAIRSEETQRQITRLHDARGALPRDDRVDVLSASISHWRECMHMDVDKIIANNKDKEHEQVVKQWLSDDRIFGLLGDRISGAVLNREVRIKSNNQWRSRGRTW